MTSGGSSVQVYRTYFTEKLREHGEDLRALDYGSLLSQRRKFEVLYEGIRGNGSPLDILDVGCGFGDFLGFLQSRHAPLRRYDGLDLVPGMIEIARKRYPSGHFKVRNILREGIGRRCDYAFANGIFYLRARDSPAYIRRVVRTMWNSCRQGVVFNARSKYADPAYIRREKHLYHYSPAEVVDFCFGLTRNVVLRHDYIPHEFTIYLYRDKSR